MHLSPSEYHRYLLEQTTPALRYDGGDVADWQARLRARFTDLLALPDNPHHDLNPQWLWTREHPLGSIRKLVFTAEPHADVPGYLCLPANGEPPYPVMICLQGHNSGMHISVGLDDKEEAEMPAQGDRDFALGCLGRGWAALCIEQRSFGQRAERTQQKTAPLGFCHDATMQSLMLGRPLMGQRVYDVDRAIDLLHTLPEIDPRRIGVMGNSGGGAVSLYAAGLLDRIAFTIVSCAFCSFDASKMSLYHCGCGYIPGVLQVAEMDDLAGLVAPKPMVIVAGAEDEILPIDGVRAGADHVQRIYRSADAEDRFALVVGAAGHRFYAEPAWTALLSMLSGG